MNLVKLENGLYKPAYPSDDDASKKIKVGSEVYATQKRNPEFHRKFFSLIKLGFENQDFYDNFDIYRAVQTMKSGFVIWAKDKKGKEHPFPESLAFDKMSQDRFEEVYKAVRDLIAKEIQVDPNDIDNELINYY